MTHFFCEIPQFLHLNDGKFSPSIKSTVFVSQRDVVLRTVNFMPWDYFRAGRFLPSLLKHSLPISLEHAQCVTCTKGFHRSLKEKNAKVFLCLHFGFLSYYFVFNLCLFLCFHSGEVHVLSWTYIPLCPLIYCSIYFFQQILFDTPTLMQKEIFGIWRVDVIMGLDNELEKQPVE